MAIAERADLTHSHISSAESMYKKQDYISF